MHSPEDPAQAKLATPPAGDFAEIHTAVTMDNNVTLWAEQADIVPPVCSSVIINLIILLVILAVVLMIYIVWHWITRRPVPSSLYAILIIALIILLLICVFRPSCFSAALHLSHPDGKR